jgi:CPA1 family monovalent cation:H+ antiporter
VSNTTWTILADILNRFVFVLLGTTLPHVIMSLNLQENTLLFGIGCLLYVLMFAIRYCWVRFRLVKIKEDTQSPHQTALQVATGGIHGTITLAMAFSIPTVIAGHAFAFRGQIIFIVAVVILISLLVATIVYPLILAPKKQSFTDDQYNAFTNRC